MAPGPSAVRSVGARRDGAGSDENPDGGRIVGVAVTSGRSLS